MKNFLIGVGIALFFLLIVLIVFLALKNDEAKQACFDSGGWINEYNCTENGCQWKCIHDR